MSGSLSPIPPPLVTSSGGSHVINVLEFDKEDFISWKVRFLVFLDGLEPYLLKTLEDGQFVPIDTKIVSLRLKFNAFKSLEGEKDSDVEKDQRISNEFMADLNVENHERTLLANQKRFYKRYGRVGLARKSIDKCREICYTCGKSGKYKNLKAEMAVRTKRIDDLTKEKSEKGKNEKGKSEKGLIAESFDWDEESVSSEDEGTTKIKAFMAIAKDEPSVGKANARSGQWVDITMKKALEGRGKRKEKIFLKEVIFTKANESSSMPAPGTQEPLSPLPKLRGAKPAELWLIQMDRRVSDYRIRRIADRGNEKDGPDSRARGDHFYHNRRSADRGNEKVDRDPGNISEIKGLRRRVRDLEIQHEIRQIRKRIRELELQREMRKETESRYVVWDDVNEEEEFDEEEVVNTDYEEAPVFDDDPYEAETENIFAQQDIQAKLPMDEILDKPIETPQLQKLDVNDDPVDALNINKLDNSHVVDFDASSAGLSHTKILPVINQFLGHQYIDTVKNDSNKSVFDTPSEQVAVEVSVVAESDVIGES
nr:retrovirus-related Pol polyprotein from transposon TNT 1-94 [Tanacetum cinerariifolium]